MRRSSTSEEMVYTTTRVLNDGRVDKGWGQTQRGPGADGQRVWGITSGAHTVGKLQALRRIGFPVIRGGGVVVTPQGG